MSGFDNDEHFVAGLRQVLEQRGLLRTAEMQCRFERLTTLCAPACADRLDPAFHTAWLNLPALERAVLTSHFVDRKDRTRTCADFGLTAEQFTAIARRAKATLMNRGPYGTTEQLAAA